MSQTIPTPEQAAAANRQKRENSVMRAKLLDLCIQAMDDYDGTGPVSFDLASVLAPHVTGVQELLNNAGSKWCIAVADGKLFLGTADDIKTLTATGVVGLVVPPQEPQPSLVTVTIAAPQEPEPAVTAAGEVNAGAEVTPAAEMAAAPVDKPGAEIAPPPEPADGAAADTASAPASTPAPTSVSFTPLANAEQCIENLRSTTLSAALEHLLCGKVEACGANTDVLVEALGFHGLVETVHRAFADHYGLRLSPDHIWLTIAQGFAALVNQEPELFRGKFVGHEGKQKIEIRRDGFVVGNPDNDWANCFSEFSDAIRGFIGDEKHGLLVSDFSTTGAIERAASEVVLMDTVQSYFTYQVNTLCGIASITLDGSVADWEKLQQKVQGLRQFGDIGWWLNDVDAIVAQFVRAAKGDVDADFWNSIYKFQSQSGGTRITGWIVKLLPLVKTYVEVWQRNPLLGKRLTAYQKPRGRSFWYDDGCEIHGESVGTSNLPASLSTVPFQWNYFGDVRNYQFIAGIVGYSQSEDRKVLTPVMGWAVRPAK